MSKAQVLALSVSSVERRTLTLGSLALVTATADSDSVDEDALLGLVSQTASRDESGKGTGGQRKKRNGEAIVEFCCCNPKIFRRFFAVQRVRAERVTHLNLTTIPLLTTR